MPLRSWFSAWESAERHQCVAVLLVALILSGVGCEGRLSGSDDCVWPALRDYRTGSCVTPSISEDYARLMTYARARELARAGTDVEAVIVLRDGSAPADVRELAAALPSAQVLRVDLSYSLTSDELAVPVTGPFPASGDLPSAVSAAADRAADQFAAHPIAPLREYAPVMRVMNADARFQVDGLLVRAPAQEIVEVLERFSSIVDKVEPGDLGWNTSEDM